MAYSCYEPRSQNQHITLGKWQNQGQHWVFGARGSNFGGSLGASSPPVGEMLQIVHVRKVFCV